MRLCYGNCITVGVLGNRRPVILAGPAANRMVLLDAGENFSSRWGWEVVRAHFPGMVLLRDFADRRLHRRMTAPLFKPEVLRRPMIEKDPVIRESLKSWPEAVDVNCGNKRLTLEVALRVFGASRGERSTSRYAETWRRCSTTCSRRRAFAVGAACAHGIGCAAASTGNSRGVVRRTPKISSRASLRGRMRWDDVSLTGMSLTHAGIAVRRPRDDRLRSDHEVHQACRGPCVARAPAWRVPGCAAGLRGEADLGVPPSSTTWKNHPPRFREVAARMASVFHGGR